MKILLHTAYLLAVTAAAGWAYSWVGGNGDRYGIFDLLQGQPVANAATAEKKPALLAQADAPRAEPRAPRPERRSAPGATGDNAATPGADSTAPGATLRAKPLAIGDEQIGILLGQMNSALADLTESVVPSVVSIDTTTNVDVQRLVPSGIFGFRAQHQRMESPGLGSGVIVTREGHILTNHHVVAGVDAIEVTVHDGTRYRAEWVGSDPGVDIAVLKIQPLEGAEKPEFTPLAFGDSDAVRVGEMVLAVGNPFGLSESVTRGIISNKQRQLSDGANEYLQVDAVINPGNSGGPLVNIRGEIVGINVAIFSGQQEVKVWQGIGLAIPANEARAVFEAIVHDRPLIRGYLGLELTDITLNYARALGLNSLSGSLITSVAKGSPAEAAGLRPGDALLEFDGNAIKNAEDALARIRQKKAGETAELGLIRKGQPLEATAVAQSKSDTNSIQLRSDITQTGQSITEALGFSVRDLNDRDRTALGIDGSSPAILITDVESGSQAERRFLPGDLIHYINRDPVDSVEKFYDLLGSLPESRASVMVLSRNGRRLTAVLNP